MTTAKDRTGVGAMDPSTIAELVSRELPISVPHVISDVDRRTLTIADGDEQIVLSIELFAKGSDLVTLGEALRRVGEVFE